MDDGDIAELSRNRAKFWNCKGEPRQKPPVHIDWDVTMVDKGGYPRLCSRRSTNRAPCSGTQWRSSMKAVSTSRGASLDESVASWKRLHIVACGTSYYAALVAERFLEEIARLRHTGRCRLGIPLSEHTHRSRYPRRLRFPVGRNRRHPRGRADR